MKKPKCTLTKSGLRNSLEAALEIGWRASSDGMSLELAKIQAATCFSAFAHKCANLPDGFVAMPLKLGHLKAGK